MTLSLNRDFLIRHLFALGVFVALSGWFGYDAFVRYPAVPARDLYVSIEAVKPEQLEAVKAMPEAELEAFKSEKISIQYAFTFLTLVAGLAVGLHLLCVARFAFTYDDEGFSCNGVRHPYTEITAVDARNWQRKGIFSLAGDGWKVVLDSWHHTGVKDFYEKVKNRG